MRTQVTDIFHFPLTEWVQRVDFGAKKFWSPDQPFSQYGGFFHYGNLIWGVKNGHKSLILLKNSLIWCAGVSQCTPCVYQKFSKSKTKWRIYGKNYKK